VVDVFSRIWRWRTNRLMVVAVLPPLAGVLLAAGGSAPAAAGARAGAGSGAGAGAGRAPGWVTTWGGAAMSPDPSVSTVQSLDNQTVRNIIYTSVGGSELRIRVSNAFGDRAQEIGSATVALELRGAQLDPATTHAITFGGSGSVLVPQGGSVLSDPVRMAVPPLTDLAVSLYLPGSGPVTYDQFSAQDNYIASGDHAADPADTAFTTSATTWFYLDAVQVKTRAPGAIVAVGDSITDVQGQNNANTRWPNFLARQFAAADGPAAPAVVDEGIAGNRILNNSSCFGVSLFDRLDRDVFSQPGIRTVVLLEGINDLGFSQEPDSGCFTPNPQITPQQLIDAYQQIIHLAHARGLRIYAGTLMPAEGFSYWDSAAEQKWLAVNNWIRGSHAFDGVIDFANLVAYPGHRGLLDPKYDSGDHLHPNDAGFQAMANAVYHVLTAHQ
jgi:lysophospholipase L1-like esterase